MKNKAEKLINKINKKYKNLSRFAALCGESYWKLYSHIYSDDAGKIAYVKALVDSTRDQCLENEIDEILLIDIKAALPKDLKGFCQANGVQHYWLQQLLSGEVIFINKKVTRLLGLLKIKP